MMIGQATTTKRISQSSWVEQESTLCVDLDGTLIRTDLLAESLSGALRQNFWIIFLLPLWLLKGRHYLKAELSRRSTVDPTLLPYNQPLIDYLLERRRGGASLCLATGADRALAHSVAGHLGFFDDVLSSDESVNLTGRRKLEAIRARFGERPFVYVANGRVDLPIWRDAAGAVTVNTSRQTERALRVEKIPIAASFPAHGSRWKAVVKALRPHQWLKNALIFVPLLLGHRVTDVRSAMGSALAFVAFCLCASSIYVLNDILDVAADRAHPRKRSRSFASGELSIFHGAGMFAALITGAVLVALWLPLEAQLLLLLYATLSVAYSVRLKEELLIDVMILAVLYTLRILAGGAASGIRISVWTLTFSVFLFLGLAIVKRLIELRTLFGTERVRLNRRAYVIEDMPVMESCAAAALYLSSVVMVLYIQSPEVLKLYAHPERLWVICVFHIYWVSRLMLLARRGSVQDDPIVFALKDGASRVIAALIVACCVLA
jgi:4-hydroxybenzoate polyprenyltransferase